MKYTNKNLFDSTLDRMRDEIKEETDIDKLRALSEEEKKHYNRPGFHISINKRIRDIKKDKIEGITDIDKLKELLEKEEDIPEQIQERINKLVRQNRLMIEGVVDLDVFDRLVNKVPFFENKGIRKEQHTQEQRKAVLERDNHTCQLCKVTGDCLLCHHIIPNGSADLINLIMLCESCHKAIHVLLQLKDYKYYMPVPYRTFY